MNTKISASSMCLFVMVIVGVGFSLEAHAVVDNAGVFDKVLSRYSDIAESWERTITARASWLFWTLATISMVWTFGMMAIRKADIAEFFAEFLRFTIFTGFFWWLLDKGPKYATSIMVSMRRIGAEAAKTGDDLSPSGIVDVGFAIFDKVVDATSIASMTDSICGVLIGLGILVVLALVAVNMLVLLISGWILAYAGIFFLGFGGSRWTSEMAIGYYRMVLNIAAQLFAMVLIVGIAKKIVDDYFMAMSGGLNLNELAVMLIVAVITFVLVRTIPAQLGSLSNSSTGALGTGFGAGHAMAAASMLGAAAATVASAAVSAAANIGGGIQAISAAISSARGGGGGGDGGGGATPPAAGTAGGDGQSGQSGVSPFAAAMGDTPAGASSSSMSGSAGGDQDGGAGGAPGGFGDSGGTQDGGGAGAAPEAGSSSGESGPSGDGEAGEAAGAGQAAGGDAASPPASDGATSETPAPPDGGGAGGGSASASGTGDSPQASSSPVSSSQGASAKGTQEGIGSGAAKAQSKLSLPVRAALVGAKTLGHLVKGGLDVGRDAFSNRMAQTVGGKIAIAIKASAAAKEWKSSLNTVSAGSEKPDAASEIAAFRDRSPNPQHP
ncbi:P-type conjugative transfer protein TrbL [Oxalobacteraceae bacterium A2-2]